VGAPTDDLVSDRPGTRFAPRAIRAASCPPGPHLEAKVDAFRELRIVDYGDAAVVPADAGRTHEAIEQLVGEVVDAGVVPVVLGGDHSITEANVRAVASRRGSVGLLHFDTHADTGFEVFGVERSHGTPMYRLVEAGYVEPTRYAQIGLRGYWPTEQEFAWQAERGISSFFMHDVRDRGIRAVLEDALTVVGGGPVFVTSTSTCSTPRSHPAREHRNPAG
jgi:arginase family enzyme